MRRVSYQILFSAMLVLPLLSVAQTFNHVYPSGGDRLGIFAEPANGGYRMVANASPVEQVVRFIGIQTDAIGVQLAADTLEFNNTGANGGRYNRLSDGSFAITSPTGSNDMYLGKVAPDGTVIWIQQYELPYFNDVSSGVVVEGNGGELFIYGYMSDWFTQYGQFYLIKAAADGQELWVKTFSAYGNNETYLPNVEGGAATADGGFLMVAVSIQNQNKFLYHFDTNGNEQVVTSFGSFNDNPTLVVEGNPGKAVFSYSISTGSFSTYNTAAMLAQYDLPSGQMDWELQLEPFDTPTWPQQSFITALSKTSDGGFLVAGYGSATGQAARFFLAKIDGMFQIVWNKHDYGFLAEASFVQAAPTGGILVAGRRDGLAWLMLMDSLGNVDCTTSYTNITAGICEGETFDFVGQTLTDAGTYTHFFQGQSPCDSIVTLDLAVHELDTSFYYEYFCLGDVGPISGNIYTQTGQFVEEAIYQSQFGCDSVVIVNIEVDSFTYIYGWGVVPYGSDFCGQIITESGVYGCYDTSEYGCITIASFELYVIYDATADKLAEQIGLTISPNPFCDEAQLRFKLQTAAIMSASIFDAQGRRVVTVVDDEKLPPGEHQLSVRTDQWPPGVYFLQLMVDGQMGMERLVKICR